jgi:hypothetical protein
MPSTRTLRFFSAAERNGTGVVTAISRNLGLPDIEVFGEQLGPGGRGRLVAGRGGFTKRRSSGGWGFGSVRWTQ